MKAKDVIDYGLEKPGTELKYPFGPETAVLTVGDKMFALLGTYQGKPSVNLKADPDAAWFQRQQYPDAVFPGYHMNKRHWNSVLLEGALPERELKELIDESYMLVRSKLTRAVQARLTLTNKHQQEDN